MPSIPRTFLRMSSGYSTTSCRILCVTLFVTLQDKRSFFFKSFFPVEKNTQSLSVVGFETTINVFAIGRSVGVSHKTVAQRREFDGGTLLAVSLEMSSSSAAAETIKFH